MQRTRLTRGGILSLCCMILCLAGNPALADTAIEMHADEWTWEENGISSFHGSILPDQSLEDAVLRLSVETRLEDSGEAIFTSVNEKQIKIRKRGPETTASLEAGTALPFEGEWNLPAETDGGLGYAAIRLTVEDAEGRKIAEGLLEAGSQEAAEALEEATPLSRMNRMIRVLAIGCGVVWLAAFVRGGILRRKREA